MLSTSSSSSIRALSHELDRLRDTMLRRDGVDSVGRSHAQLTSPFLGGSSPTVRGAQGMLPSVPETGGKVNEQSWHGVAGQVGGQEGEQMSASPVAATLLFSSPLRDQSRGPLGAHSYATTPAQRYGGTGIPPASSSPSTDATLLASVLSSPTHQYLTAASNRDVPPSPAAIKVLTKLEALERMLMSLKSPSPSHGASASHTRNSPGSFPHAAATAATSSTSTSTAVSVSVPAEASSPRIPTYTMQLSPHLLSQQSPQQRQGVDSSQSPVATDSPVQGRDLSVAILNTQALDIATRAQEAVEALGRRLEAALAAGSPFTAPTQVHPSSNFPTQVHPTTSMSDNTAGLSVSVVATGETAAAKTTVVDVVASPIAQVTLSPAPAATRIVTEKHASPVSNTVTFALPVTTAVAVVSTPPHAAGVAAQFDKPTPTTLTEDASQEILVPESTGAFTQQAQLTALPVTRTTPAGVAPPAAATATTKPSPRGVGVVERRRSFVDADSVDAFYAAHSLAVGSDESARRDIRPSMRIGPSVKPSVSPVPGRRRSLVAEHTAALANAAAAAAATHEDPDVHVATAKSLPPATAPELPIQTEVSQPAASIPAPQQLGSMHLPQPAAPISTTTTRLLPAFTPVALTSTVAPQTPTMTAAAAATAVDHNAIPVAPVVSAPARAQPAALSTSAVKSPKAIGSLIQSIVAAKTKLCTAPVDTESAIGISHEPDYDDEDEAGKHSPLLGFTQLTTSTTVSAVNAAAKPAVAPMVVTPSPTGTSSKPTAALPGISASLSESKSDAVAAAAVSSEPLPQTPLLHLALLAPATTVAPAPAATVAPAPAATGAAPAVVVRGSSHAPAGDADASNSDVDAGVGDDTHDTASGAHLAAATGEEEEPADLTDETLEFVLELLNGVVVIKHGRRGWPHKRLLWLDASAADLSFRWGKPEHGTNNPEAEVFAIGEVTDISVGMSTEVFRRSGKQKVADRYLSLVSSTRTLDLELETSQKRTYFEEHLHQLLTDPGLLQDALLYIVNNNMWQPPFPLAANQEGGSGSGTAGAGVGVDGVRSV